MLYAAMLLLGQKNSLLHGRRQQLGREGRECRAEGMQLCQQRGTASIHTHTHTCTHCDTHTFAHHHHHTTTKHPPTCPAQQAAGLAAPPAGGQRPPAPAPGAAAARHRPLAAKAAAGTWAPPPPPGLQQWQAGSRAGRGERVNGPLEHGLSRRHQGCSQQGQGGGARR